MRPLPPPVRRLALFLFAVFALAVASHFVRPARARLSLPTGDAEWIWKPLARDESSPVDFFLARDFFLDPPPARGLLLVAADEEYILSLNGHRIGSGGYAAAASGWGTQLDVYSPGDWLRPGGNRLIAEVRSGRGAGGFLLALVDPASRRVLLGTDGSWRVFYRDHPFLFRGLLPLVPQLESGTEAAFSWGLPPFGRWGTPRPGARRPLDPELTAGRPTVAAQAPTVIATPPAPGLSPVPRMVFDFGREVTGFLELDVAAVSVQRSGLLYFSTEQVPDILTRRADAAVITIPRRGSWEDARPRRFRYVMVVGVSPKAARVQTVDPLAAPIAPRRAGGVPGGVPGLLGIVPPPLRTPIEHEVGRKFQRVPSVAGREEF